MIDSTERDNTYLVGDDDSDAELIGNAQQTTQKLAQVDLTLTQLATAAVSVRACVCVY
jgi:hypothetical protein